MKSLEQRLTETGFGGEIDDTIPPILHTVKEWLEDIQQQNLKNQKIAYDSQVIIDRFLNKLIASVLTRQTKEGET